MGDRANICVHDEKGEVYLYTHWAGTELPKTLQSALKRGEERWSDSPYLARIIFCEMVNGQERELTGFGISPYVCDGKVLDVYPDEQIVKFRKNGKSFPFKEFCELSHVEW